MSLKQLRSPRYRASEGPGSQAGSNEPLQAPAQSLRRRWTDCEGEVLGEGAEELTQGDRELGSSGKAGSPPVADPPTFEVWD